MVGVVLDDIEIVAFVNPERKRMPRAVVALPVGSAGVAQALKQVACRGEGVGPAVESAVVDDVHGVDGFAIAVPTDARAIRETGLAGDAAREGTSGGKNRREKEGGGE